MVIHVTSNVTGQPMATAKCVVPAAMDIAAPNTIRDFSRSLGLCFIC